MEELSHEDLLNGEKESLGFYFSKHPLKPYEHLIRQLTPYDSQNLKETDASDDVSIAGIVNAMKEITTKRGDRMAYLTLEDTKGDRTETNEAPVQEINCRIQTSRRPANWCRRDPKGAKDVVVSGKIDDCRSATCSRF